MKLYMFRTVPLSIIRGFLMSRRQWDMSYRFADSLRAGSGWNCPKHGESHFKNKFEKLVGLVGIIIRNFVCFIFCPLHNALCSAYCNRISYKYVLRAWMRLDACSVHNCSCILAESTQFLGGRSWSLYPYLRSVKTTGSIPVTGQ